MTASYLIWDEGWRIIPYHLFWIGLGLLIGYVIGYNHKDKRKMKK